MKKKIRIPNLLNLLLVSFVFLIIMVIIYSVYLSNKLSGLSFQIYNHPFVVTNEIKDININLNNIVAASEYIALDYITDIKEEMGKIVALEDNIEESINVVKEKYSGNKDLVFEAENAFNDYTVVLRKNIIIKIRNTENPDIVLQDEKLNDFRVTLNKLYKGSINNASDYYSQIDIENNKLIKFMFAFLVITFAYGIGFLFVINTKIKKPLSKITKRIEEIFEDDIAKRNEVVKMNDIELLVMTVEYLESTKVKLEDEIKKRALTEASMKQFNEEIKNTMLSKDKLFSIIAHDLINPFQGIIGFSQYIIENIKTIPVEEMEELLGHINNSAINQYYLLQNLLNWSKSQIGELEFKKELLNVYRLVEEVFKNVSLMASSKSIKLINETEQEKFIYSDRRVLFIVLNNLITNAIKFSYPDNKIVVSFTEDNLYKIIKVQDFGCGIESNKIDKIFNISNKDIKIGTSGEKGSGLGLLICNEFIAKQGGKILVESQLNSGSTFFVFLPKEMFQKSNLSFS